MALKKRQIDEAAYEYHPRSIDLRKAFVNGAYFAKCEYERQARQEAKLRKQNEDDVIKTLKNLYPED